MPHPHLTINRRHPRTNQLLGLVLHHIRPYLDQSPGSRAARDVARVLDELFHTSGVQIITEADRAAAGLPPRDHNGMTLEEIVIIEERLREAMLAPMGPVIMPDLAMHRLTCDQTLCPLRGHDIASLGYKKP